MRRTRLGSIGNSSAHAMALACVVCLADPRFPTVTANFSRARLLRTFSSVPLSHVMSLTLPREDAGYPVTLPADVSALLVRRYPNAAAEVRAVSALGHVVVTPPSNVVLLGQSVADGPLLPQSVLRTSTHSWHPATSPARSADHVLFVGQPLHGGSSPSNSARPQPKPKQSNNAELISTASNRNSRLHLHRTASRMRMPRSMAS